MRAQFLGWSDGAIYFATRELVVPESGSSLLARWRLSLFAFLYRNEVEVIDRFSLPLENVVEIARQIQVWITIDARQSCPPVHRSRLTEVMRAQNHAAIILAPSPLAGNLIAADGFGPGRFSTKFAHHALPTPGSADHGP